MNLLYSLGEGQHEKGVFTGMPSGFAGVFGIYGNHQGPFRKHRRRVFYRFAHIFSIYQANPRAFGPAAAGPDENISILDVDMALIRSVTLNDVYEFMNYLKTERHNTSKTRARKTTSLRMFFRYLTDYKHVLDVNPVQNLDTPKQKKGLPQYLTLDQSMALLQSVDGEFAQRDYCMLVLFLNCGSAGRSWPGSICGISGLIIR